MKKVLLLLLLLGMTSGVFAQTDVSYFYGDGCHFCATVAESGVLDEVALMDDVVLSKFEIYNNDSGRLKYSEYADGFGVEQRNRGVPFVVVECEGGSDYIIGTAMIDDLEDSVENCGENDLWDVADYDAGRITLGSLIIAALIDSVNPCAFGVLIFLMLGLLQMGSSKRALRAGLIYTFVVFVVYFLSGLGIFRIIQSFTSITHFIYLLSGVLVFMLGLWQFKDVLIPSFGPSLKISNKAKPFIEKMVYHGTIPAMILLGIVVSLFELPCTGGIYLGILTMMSINDTFAIWYLLLYNFIFVLPLIILTFMIYKGTSPEVLQNWNTKKRTWMKIGSGAVLILLGMYIIFA
jgi:cytochrome c biogenesis protein CcdA